MLKDNKPEILFKDPNDFYTVKEANRYDQNTGMKKMQLELTQIALDLAKPISENKDINILDIGCGTGFSLEYLKGLGYFSIKGIDPSKEMINIAKIKKLNVKIGGFENLDKITEKFDFIISISSFQWSITNKKDIEIKNIVKKIGKKIFKILKKNGVCVIQFYPDCVIKSDFKEGDLIDIIISSFKRCDFLVDFYIYKEESLKKRKLFLILKPKI